MVDFAPNIAEIMVAQGKFESETEAWRHVETEEYQESLPHLVGGTHYAPGHEPPGVMPYWETGVVAEVAVEDSVALDLASKLPAAGSFIPEGELPPLPEPGFWQREKEIAWLLEGTEPALGIVPLGGGGAWWTAIPALVGAAGFLADVLNLDWGLFQEPGKPAPGPEGPGIYSPETGISGPSGPGGYLYGGGIMPDGTTAMTKLNGDYLFRGVVLQGPGLKEPHPGLVSKHWTQRFDSPRGDVKVEYWILIDGRRLSYNHKTGRYHLWRQPRMAVIGKNLPSHKQITRLRHNLKRHKDDAKTILQLTAPGLLNTPGAGLTHKRRKYKR